MSSTIRNAVINLYAFMPGDHGTDAPLLSEASLYPLLGKNDARQFMALVDTLVKTLDMDINSILREANQQIESRTANKVTYQFSTPKDAKTFRNDVVSVVGISMCADDAIPMVTIPVQWVEHDQPKPLLDKFDQPRYTVRGLPMTSSGSYVGTPNQRQVAGMSLARTELINDMALRAGGIIIKESMQYSS